MKNSAEKILVTGMGIISTLGSDLETVSNSLQKGESGIVFDSSRKEKGFRSGLTGKIRDFDISRYSLTKKQLKTMGEPAVYAYSAAVNALNDASLDLSMNPLRTGIIIGNDSCIKASHDAVETIKQSGETKSIGSGAIFKSMNSTVSMNLSTLFGIKGYSMTLSAACASGAHSIGHAFMLLKLGYLDAVVCGGAQELNWEVYASFDGLGAFSGRENEPHRASRPFDKDRDGLIPSGGGAIVILETESHALKRNAKKIYGELVSYGFSSDGQHLSVPSGEGGKRAIHMALKQAHLKPLDIDYINAHATSTIEGDKAEAEMIASVFHDEVPVSSTKSLTGHECWMAGSSEVIYSLLMMKDGFLAANANFSEQETEISKIAVVRNTIKCKPKVIMSNSFGFGGTNAVLILRNV